MMVSLAGEVSMKEANSQRPRVKDGGRAVFFFLKKKTRQRHKSTGAVKTMTVVSRSYRCAHSRLEFSMMSNAPKPRVTSARNSVRPLGGCPDGFSLLLANPAAPAMT
jgi:hypothetical protein